MTPTYNLYGKELPIPKKPEFEVYFDPTTTVVISIDMHEGHLSEADDCPCPAPRGRAIIEAVDAFHRSARQRGVPVLHVVSKLKQSGLDDINGIPAAWRHTMPEYTGPIRGINEHGVSGSKWTELCTEFLEGDELIDTKRRLSAFYPTDLDFVLRQMGVKTVIITGINTDCCVLNSAFDASNRNYRVIVLSDATAGTDEYLEKASLSIISLFLGVVMSSDQLLKKWSAPLQ